MASTAASASWVFHLLAAWFLCMAAITDGESWCVAKINVSDKQLQSALDYACGAGADCGAIQPDGLCYFPNTVLAHASYAFNSFYQNKDRTPGTCDFAGSAVLALTDPSYGLCTYPSSANSTTINGSSTPPPSTVTAPPTPSIQTPPTPSTQPPTTVTAPASSTPPAPKATPPTSSSGVDHPRNNSGASLRSVSIIPLIPVLFSLCYLAF